MITPIQKIKSFIAENRTSDALARLLELSQNNKQINDAVHIVLAEFNDLTSQRIKGTIDNSEVSRRQNIIHDKILIALGAFDSQGRVLPGSVASKSNSSTTVLRNITLFLLGIGGAMLFISQSIIKEGSNGVILNIGFAVLAFGSLAFVSYLLAMIVSAFKAK